MKIFQMQILFKYLKLLKIDKENQIKKKKSRNNHKIINNKLKNQSKLNQMILIKNKIIIIKLKNKRKLRILKLKNVH